MAADPTVFAWEPISTALASGMEDLIAFNWDEVSSGLDFPPLDIDWPAYLMQERAGFYRGVSARKSTKLIGYNGYFIRPPLRHKSSLWAINDALYLDKDARAGLLGLKLLTESHKLLKTAGVKWVSQTDMAVENSTTAKPRASFGDLLTRIGYRPMGRSYLLKL